MNDNRQLMKDMIKEFYPFAQKRLGFNKPAKIYLSYDAENAKNPLGKTAHYNPTDSSIVVYAVDRHPKDVLRSVSHELVHHNQNCNGEFANTEEVGENYAQNDSHLRKMEENAYLEGNMILRDYEDLKKSPMKEKKANPWAVCRTSVGRENNKKYERCVMDVKKQQNLKENKDLEKDLDDLEEKDTVKDHFSKRADRVFKELSERWGLNKKEQPKKEDKND